MRNKRGQVFLGVVLGLFIWISGILLLPYILPNIDAAYSGLNCAISSITDGSKLMCLLVDFIVPYFIWFLISMCIGLIIGGRK